MRIGLALILLSLSPAGAQAAATPEGFPVAGGIVAPSPNGGYHYVNAPIVAVAAPGSACETSARYVAIANRAAWDEMSSLFAENATFGTPGGAGGMFIRGKSAISHFYSERVRNLKQHSLLIPVQYSNLGQECYVTLVFTTDRKSYTIGMIEHFTVGRDGKIVELVAYNR
jgi:hypothetical protein